MNQKLFSCILLFTLLTACSGDDNEAAPAIQLISVSVDGSNASGSISEVGLNPTIELTFNTAVAAADFRDAFSLRIQDSQEIPFDLFFTNSSSRAVVTPALQYASSYTLSIAALPIGANGGRLSAPYTLTLRTMEDSTIRSMAPCGTASAICERSISFDLGDGDRDFTFFSNYPVFEENAEWEELTSAIILVHGAGRNSDEYFAWMNSTLNSLNLSESTVLIAPSFRAATEASDNELYWGSGNNWREGGVALNGNISSFSVIDSLLKQLGNQERFPVLEHVVVTGHSSGGLFTHTYGAANASEDLLNHLSIDYVVANSQYFYYPTNERINESNGQLYIPAGCSTYEFWPYGYNSIPSYLATISKSELNNQFADRTIYYLLGNGTQSDPTLNTTDCAATLLGSSRYQRGENMFQFMDLKYGENHAHQKIIVPGIGHNGQAMYQSEEWKALLVSLVAPSE